MNPLVLTLAFIAQSPFTPNTAIPPRTSSPAHELFDPNQSPAPTAEARRAVHDLGRCVAGRSPNVAAQVLQRDFRSISYRSGMRELARNNEGCFTARGERLRSSGLLFAAAVAEGLLTQDATPLNVRLARAASRPAPTPFSPSDATAICVVRSVPDDAARLLATQAASAEEEAAARELQLVVDRCSESRARTVASAAGLRAILATAAFRTVSAGEASAARD